MTITQRLATLDDIAAMHKLRRSVRENPLRDPSRVTEAHYVRYVSEPGSSWIAEERGRIVGFGIADRPSRSIWALFVDSEFEGRGVGRSLLGHVTNWLLLQSDSPINLSTEPGTRAERLYLAAGWRKIGVLETGEVWLTRNADGGS